MEKDKITLEFCLHEIANNITQYKSFGMRIGKSSIGFMVEGYEVIDWHGKRSYHADLIAAIEKFIEVQEQ